MILAIEAESVRKDFGTIRALDSLSFSVNSGEIFGLIGPNGAGKTTCLRVVSTLLLPTSGSMKVFGTDVVQNAAEVRRMITYLPEEAERTEISQAGNTWSSWPNSWQQTKLMSKR